MRLSGTSPVQVFPGGSVPANLLRWHLLFDEPVDATEVAGAITLLDGAGAAVPHAFVDMPGGLWDESGTRLTLLLHPGRIKGGLQAQAQLGGALAVGQRMSLRIDLEGLVGTCLGTVEHVFSVGQAEGRKIDIHAWRLGSVEAGSRQRLVVEFDRLMDRLSLDGAMAVVDASGQPLDGSMLTTSDGAALAFVPRHVWRVGMHRLAVAEDLEDVAGNRIAAPFESTLQWTQSAHLDRAFAVEPAKHCSFESGRG